MVLRARAGNLLAALVVVGLAELALNRVASRLFLPHPSRVQSVWMRGLIEASPFLFHLAGVLGLGVFVVGIAGTLRRREVFVPGMRLSLLVIGGVFVSLAAYGILLARLPERWFVHLHTSYAFMSALIAAAFVRTPTPARVKLGVALFAVPGILHGVALFLDRMSWFKGSATLLTDITRAGELGALLAASGSPLLLPARPPGLRRLAPALAVSAAAAAGLVAALALNFDGVQTVALYGLRFDIPSPPGARTFIFVVGLFGLSLAAAQLLAVPGPSRLMGYGVLAVATAGYQLSSPHEMVLALSGLLALAVGGLRAHDSPARAPRFAEADWRPFISRLAAAAAASEDANASARPPEAVIVRDDDVEITRIRCTRRGRPVSLRLRRRGDVILELEAVIGEPGRGEPDAVVEPRGGSLVRGLAARLGQRKSATDDPDFDRRYLVRGDAPLGDEPLRLRLLQHTAGTIALWNERAVRYRALLGRGSIPDQPVGPSLDPKPIVDLLDTLADLLEAT